MSRLFDFSIPALFELVSDETADALTKASVKKRFRDGEAVHVQGENAESMGLIESGAVAFGKYSVDEGFLTLIELGQGHHYGEYTALEPEPRRLGAQAIGDTVIREIPHHALQALMEEHPDLMLAFLKVSSARTGLLLEIYDDARRLPSSQRIARLLQILHRGREQGTALPFTQGDLSIILGISKVTVNQTLKRLEEQSVIETGYRFIRVVDLAALRRFAERR